MKDSILTENDRNEAMDEKYCKLIEQPEKSDKINFYYDVEEHYENISEKSGAFIKEDIVSSAMIKSLKSPDTSCGGLRRKCTKPILIASLIFNVIMIACVCYIIHKFLSPKNMKKEPCATCNRDINLDHPICVPCSDFNRLSNGKPVVIQINEAAPSLCCMEKYIHLHFLLKMILMEKQRIQFPKENRKPPLFMNLPIKTTGDGLDWEKPMNVENRGAVSIVGNKIHVNETGTYSIMMSVVLQTQGDNGVNNFTAAINNYQPHGQSVIAQKVSIHSNQGMTFKGCQMFDVIRFTKGQILSLELSNVPLIYRYRFTNYFGMMKIQ